MGRNQPEREKFRCLYEAFHQAMINKEFHAKFDDEQIDGILRGEESNRRVVLNYVYRGVEFVAMLEKIKSGVKFSFQKDKIIYNIDQKIVIDNFIMFNKDLNSFQLNDEHKFNEAVDIIKGEIITEGSKSTAKTAIQVKDDGYEAMLLTILSYNTIASLSSPSADKSISERCSINVELSSKTTTTMQHSLTRVDVSSPYNDIA
ncbi:unnamed protein product [Adineta steineri]|uniref:Uncharacterized protein n=2 Tax=Adineta steineri TaxID=433720 RepID=A0A819ZBC0_9BILA|nr:unnamed protein product [Adineta steineri]